MIAPARPSRADTDGPTPDDTLSYTRAMLVSLQKLSPQHRVLNHLMALAVSEAEYLLEDQEQQNNKSSER
jgi:hypothetical protein